MQQTWTQQLVSCGPTPLWGGGREAGPDPAWLLTSMRASLVHEEPVALRLLQAEASAAGVRVAVCALAFSHGAVPCDQHT